MIELKLQQKDLNRINGLLKELDPKKQGGAIQKGIQSGSSLVLKQLVANCSGIILKRRTGNLAKSLGWRVDKDQNGNWEGIIGSGATLKTNRMIYANILETGGVIRPVTAKMLAIPIGEALTPAGVARFKPREITSQGGYEKSFIRRSKSGNLLLFGARGKSITPLFVLKDSVTIPEFRYMAITVEQTQGKVVDAIVDKIKEVKEKG
jgi:hypothetical protein